MLPLTGAILTKLDGDSRGGAALSIRTVARVPIRFVGMGEKADDLELFHPERMASRMIGMGDVMSLIEKAERGLDRPRPSGWPSASSTRSSPWRICATSSASSRSWAPSPRCSRSSPRSAPARPRPPSVDESGLKKVEAIINSMTPLERRRPDVLNGSRKKRIAMGSGTSVAEINRLFKQYDRCRR